MVFRAAAIVLVLIAAIATFMAFRNKSTAEPARKRFLPQSVLQKVSETAETNSSGDDVDKLNRALGDRMQKLLPNSAPCSRHEKVKFLSCVFYRQTSQAIVTMQT